MTAPLTEAEIREALARAERATPGPWVRWNGHTRIVAGTPTENTSGCISRFRRIVADTENEDEGGPLDVINAEFIAHARTDVPRLAADLLAAREALDEAVKAFMGLWAVSGDAIRAAKEPSLNPWIGEEPWKKHIRDMAQIERTATLLSPPTPSPHTCQINRATSGASDCGLEPCEEAVVHRDLGTPSPPDPRDAEIAALRARVEKLEAVERDAREYLRTAEKVIHAPEKVKATVYDNARVGLHFALAAAEVQRG